MLVLDGDLHLVPFAMLKAPSAQEALCERFGLLVAPSLTSIRTAARKSGKSTNADIGDGGGENSNNCLVVGNPKLPSPVAEQWGWNDIGMVLLGELPDIM